MTDLATKINSLDREYRAPVALAVALAAGSWTALESELASLTWEYPDLPVSDILHQLR